MEGYSTFRRWLLNYGRPREVVELAATDDRIRKKPLAAHTRAAILTPYLQSFLVYSLHKVLWDAHNVLDLLKTRNYRFAHIPKTRKTRKIYGFIGRHNNNNNNNSRISIPPSVVTSEALIYRYETPQFHDCNQSLGSFDSTLTFNRLTSKVYYSVVLHIVTKYEVRASAR